MTLNAKQIIRQRIEKIEEQMYAATGAHAGQETANLREIRDEMRKREHEASAVTLEVATDEINSCTSCGRSNYKMREVVGEDGNASTFTNEGADLPEDGIAMLRVGTQSGWCTNFCDDCLREVVTLASALLTLKAAK